uniref:DLEC1 cilia and flagella associated protein n=1 Tax=Lates calcarifer TaxID=8187 RepID=A0A4W6DBE1_LATCA
KNRRRDRSRCLTRLLTDISHVLASTFKDLYTKDIIGKDTLSNLIKSRSGRSSYHDKYVEELQQAHSEYSRRIKEADMLESHIIQARTRAATTESQDDKAEAWEKLQKLRDRHRFLRNPHFLPPNAQPGGMSLIHPRGVVVFVLSLFESSTDDPVPVFLAKPSVVVFTDYSVGHVYETTLELKNLTSSSRHVRVIPPTTSYFSIGLGRFPGEGGVVAPGMSCKYTVRFAPDSLADYEDFIVVQSQAEHLLVVPIAARRPPPILTLPRVLDCGYCLIGGVKFVEFLCQNVGLSSGTFCIIPKNQWPPAARTYFCEQPPFAISPSLFVLQPGEATVVEVVFFPTTAEKSCQVFTVVCDNCQVKDISIEGEGQLIALELVSVSGEKEPPVIGEVHDLTAEHFVRFSPCNPQSVQQKKLIIRNNVHLELPFHWQILKPNLLPLTGILAPCQDQEFLFTFSPKELKDYHSVCHLVLRDVPHSLYEHALQPVRTGSKVHDVIVMEIEVKGSTEPYQVLLEPYAVVIPGEIFICTTIHRQFKMWNHSKTFIFFHWERMNSSSHIIEVEPSTGRIEENECFDFDLIVTGGKPERVVTSLLCHIEHHHEPIALAVEVSFKGPIVTLSVPSVDFGLMRLGEQTQTTLLLTNTTQLEASWTIEDNQQDHQDAQVQWTNMTTYIQFVPFYLVIFIDAQVLVEPCRGVLPPLTSCSVDVFFRPRFCQQLETELELTVENGIGCHLSVRADVQSPQVCLMNCELFFSELYIGIPAKSAVTLFNQTLLPSHFRWMVCCSTIIILSPLNISGVNVAVHNLSTPDDESPSELLLDFGGNVVLKRAVTKQFLITNQSAVPAPFTIEAEYFHCHAAKPNTQSKKSCDCVLLCLLKEFVSSLLAHGKGAAFYVLPNTGTLGPFETQTVDVTAYTDMWGEYRDRLICKVGDLEPTLIPMQMTVKGCPLYFQMTGPRPDDQNQGPIIQFGTHVSGGDTVSRSLRINNPTMFDIRMDWETYNVDQDDRKLVDMVVAYGDAFPVKDTDGNEVMSGAIRLSDGSIQTAWERARTPGSEGTSTSPHSKTKKLFSVHIRPHVGNLSDYPYCITPQQIVIPAKSSSTVHVSFTPLTLSSSACEARCVGLALGFMSLDSKMAAFVLAITILLFMSPKPLMHPTQFMLPKLKIMREFDVTQTLQLKNTLEMPLHFRLVTQHPFIVLRPQPRAQTSTSSNPPTGDSQSLVLQQQNSMQVKVAFHCSLPLLDHGDQTDEEVPPGVTLIHSTSGQRKLRFQQNLLIHYSNNSLQIVPLCAYLDLSTLRLSTHSVNFGFCYVGQMETVEVNLYSHGAHTYWKSVIGEPHVKINLPFVICCSEDREFRATVVIWSPLVKTPLTLQLQGAGSFDEMYRSS